LGRRVRWDGGKSGLEKGGHAQTTGAERRNAKRGKTPNTGTRALEGTRGTGGGEGSSKEYFTKWTENFERNRVCPEVSNVEK